MKISKGKKQNPLKLVIYGPEGCGKSTLASGAESPLFLDIEQGSDNLNVDRVSDIASYDDLVNSLREIYKSKDLQYKTIVLDSAEAVEELCKKKTIIDDRADSIEGVQDGYGKGYTIASEHFFNILHALNMIWRKGYHVIVIGHSEVKTFINPEGIDYDRFKLRLDKRNEPSVKEWAEALLFMNFETVVKEDKGGFAKDKGKGKSFGKRVLHTTRHAAFDAKNRYDMQDKIYIPKEAPFQAFMTEFNKGKGETSK